MNENDQSPPPRRRTPWTPLLLLLLAGAGYYAWSLHGQVAAQAEQVAALTAARDEAIAEAERRQAALVESEQRLAAADEAAKQREALETGRAELEAQLQAARAEVQHLQAAAAAVPIAAPTAVPEAVPSPAQPVPVTAPSKPAPVPPQTLTITFDVNSSYFPASLNGRLRRLATDLEPGQAYAVRLTGSVGTDPVENGGPADAAAYNRWIAERRVDRVADFLDDHADGAELTIERSFARQDPSRRVVVSIRPILP